MRSYNTASRVISCQPITSIQKLLRVQILHPIPRLKVTKTSTHTQKISKLIKNLGQRRLILVKRSESLFDVIKRCLIPLEQAMNPFPRKKKDLSDSSNEL